MGQSSHAFGSRTAHCSIIIDTVATVAIDAVAKGTLVVDTGHVQQATCQAACMQKQDLAALPTWLKAAAKAHKMHLGGSS